MIEQRKPGVALEVISMVLKQARKLAEDEAVDMKAIANVLDLSEFLPLLVADKRDRSEEFRGTLAELVSWHPSFQTALDHLNGGD